MSLNEKFTRHSFRNEREKAETGLIRLLSPGVHYAGFVLKKLWRDKKLRLYLLLSFVLLKVLIILVLLFLVPAVREITNHSDQEVVKGLLESFSGITGRIRSCA